MSLPAESPFRISRDERRITLSQRYLEVLPELLENERYSDLSIERMIKVASISRASFYRYFDDKNDLLRTMMGHVIDDLMNAGDEWWNLPVTATRRELEVAHRNIVAIYRRHRHILRAVVEGTGYDAGLRELYGALISRSIDNVHGHIEHGQREGFIAPDVKARETAELLVYMGERSLFQKIAVENETDDARYPDPLADIYWRTLYEGYRDEAPSA